MSIGIMEIDARSLLTMCSLYLKRVEDLKTKQLNEAFEVKMLKRFKVIIPSKLYNKIYDKLMSLIQADYEDKLKRLQNMKAGDLMSHHFADNILNSGLFKRIDVYELKQMCEFAIEHEFDSKIKISSETAAELHRVF